MVFISRVQEWLNVRKLLVILVAGLFCGGLSAELVAQTTTRSTPNPRAAYQPSLGDLMTMAIQPRHLKLALAGREKNWAYAAYELQQLHEAFERVARAWPQWKTLPFSDMVTGTMEEPFAALEHAIKSADANRFVAAYKTLTEGCNVCHQAANVGVNVIRVPQGSPFPNQDFRPAKS
jgi:hypothetical protein